MRIGLIDYGAGNLASVLKAFAAAGAEVVKPARPDDLTRCAGIVVPGVGNFAVTSSIDDDWREAIRSRLDAGVPLLGICLGMQWLFEGSEEAIGVNGLGLIGGRCARIAAARPLKVPHVGWNALNLIRHSPLLDGVADGTHVYFTHTFAAPVTSECSASVTHGHELAAVVQREHVAGVQFHPEKSGPAGLRILSNFIAMTRA